MKPKFVLALKYKSTPSFLFCYQAKAGTKTKMQEVQHLLPRHQSKVYSSFLLHVFRSLTMECPLFLCVKAVNRRIVNCRRINLQQRVNCMKPK